MLAYRYNEDTKEFEYSMEAQENPIDGGYLLPGHSTFKKVPEYGEGYIPVYNLEKDKWIVEEDHRKHYQVKLDDITFSEVDYIGSAKEGYQFVTDEEYDNWQRDKDRYKVIDGVFTDVSNTPEYKALKLEEAKNDKYNEAVSGAYRYLDSEATFSFAPDYNIEATKENMNTFSSAIIAIEKGLMPYQEWTSKEDNIRQLSAEDCLVIAIGIKNIQSEVWNQKFIAYKNRINNARTIDEVEDIVIDYAS